MTGLAVVIVTSNPGVNLTKCLASLAKQSFTEFEVTVIYSGCTAPDHLASPTKGHLGQTRLITAANRGYGAACNIGARYVYSATYLVFLNDDTELHPDCLRSLYTSLTKDGNSIFQPLLFHEYARRLMRGNPCDIYGAAGLGFYGNCGSGRFYVSGASIAMSKKIFDSLRGFDEELFLYHDDVDLSWRARLMGYGISCSESALCLHTGASSSKTIPHEVKFYLTQRNRIRVMIKNYSTRRMLLRVTVACTMILAGAIFFTISARRISYVTSTCRAFMWNLLELKGTLMERYRVQRSRIQDDAAVERSMSKFSMDLCVLKKHIIGT